MKNNIKVSVIIPIYNTSKYLKECLDSVYNQTLKEIEIICIDDKSTDDSLNILKKYKEKYDKDNKITIIEQKKNQGPGIARNIGLNIAKGEYIGFVDSDDYISLDYFEKLYNKAVDLSINVICNDFYKNLKNLCNTFINVNSENIETLPKSTVHYFLNNNFLKKYKLRFEVNSKIGEDLYFYTILLSHLYENNEKMYIVNYYYKTRENPNSITRTMDRTEIFKAIEYIYIYFKKKNLLDKLPISLYTHEINDYFGGFDKNIMYNEMRKLFLKFSKDNLINWNLYDNKVSLIYTQILTYDSYKDYKKNKDNEEIKNSLEKLNSVYDKTYEIFGIPLLKITNRNYQWKHSKTKIYLFNFIPILTIRKNRLN